MTNEQKEKLNRVEGMVKNGINLGTACQLLGFDVHEIKKLQNEKDIELPDFIKDLFKGFDKNSDH